MFKEFAADDKRLSVGIEQISKEFLHASKVGLNGLQGNCFAWSALNEANGTIVTAKKAHNNHSKFFRVCLKNNEAIIEYSSLSSFYSGIAYLLLMLSGKSSQMENAFSQSKVANKEHCFSEHKGARLGYMLDCSRNAVAKPSSVKKLIRTLALCGYDYLQLYTEDTYEIEGEPYFGYLRGRYTAAELKDLVAYGEIFGIELVPCIQTLAHLNAIFKWDAYENIKDIEDILLVDEGKTYALIEKMIASAANVFNSKTIMIGMDEAHMLGHGEYLNRFGKANKGDIMLNHLNKVVDLCEKYGLKPNMWGDMFFRAQFGEYYVSDKNANFSEEVKKTVSRVKPIYWDYYNFDGELYDNMLRLTQQLSPDIGFAGGLWKWMGYVPNVSMTEETLKISMASAAKVEVGDIMLTAWGDNGAECPLVTSLSGIVYASQLNYQGNTENLSERTDWLSLLILGYKHTDIKVLEHCNLPYSSQDAVNRNKIMYYTDVLLNLFEDRFEEGDDEKFLIYANEIKNIACNLGLSCENATDALASLIPFNEALACKNQLAIGLRAAYKSGDKKFLQSAATQIIPLLVEKSEQFFELIQKIWLKENKPFGLEVLHIRHGALKERLNFAAKRINAFLNGEIESIEELSEELLSYSTKTKDLLCNSWQQIVTVQPL